MDRRNGRAPETLVSKRFSKSPLRALDVTVLCQAGYQGDSLCPWESKVGLMTLPGDAVVRGRPNQSGNPAQTVWAPGCRVSERGQPATHGAMETEGSLISVPLADQALGGAGTLFQSLGPWFLSADKASSVCPVLQL